MEMQWWNKLQAFFYKRSKTERVTALKVNRAILNIEDAHTVGIIYDSTNQANDAVIAQFAESLVKQGKSVEILAFVNDAKIESKPGIPIFNKKQVNWYNVPAWETIAPFANKNFDLLLACFTTENLPLEYVSAASQARWRVGAFHENKTDNYDMMVNMGGRTELAYFLQQVISFLSRIKAA